MYLTSEISQCALTLTYAHYFPNVCPFRDPPCYPRSPNRPLLIDPRRYPIFQSAKPKTPAWSPTSCTPKAILRFGSPRRRDSAYQNPSLAFRILGDHDHVLYLELPPHRRRCRCCRCYNGHHARRASSFLTQSHSFRTSPSASTAPVGSPRLSMGCRCCRCRKLRFYLPIRYLRYVRM